MHTIIRRSRVQKPTEASKENCRRVAEKCARGRKRARGRKCARGRQLCSETSEDAQGASDEEEEVHEAWAEENQEEFDPPFGRVLTRLEEGGMHWRVLPPRSVVLGDRDHRVTGPCGQHEVSVLVEASLPRPGQCFSGLFGLDRGGSSGSSSRRSV